MRVTGETYMRDTVLVCQLKNNSVLFCRFSALPNSAEFRRILQKSALQNSAETRPFLFLF
jgi:hypothetical protein